MSGSAILRSLVVGLSLLALTCGSHPKAPTKFAAGTPRRTVAIPRTRNALNPGSSRAVRSLEEPIWVDAYLLRGAPNLNQFVQVLTNLLEAYHHEGGGKFQYRLLEGNSQEVREQAKAVGLQPATFSEPNATDNFGTIARGYSGLVFKYKSETSVIPLLRPEFGDGLEYWITSQIREVRDTADGIKRRVGVVTGKDELKLSDRNLIPRRGRQGSPSIQQILTQAFPFYSIEDVDLKDGTQAIHDELAGLIITQPRQDFSDKELRHIDEFLMRGNKSLVVFASAVTLEPQNPRMEARLSTHRLETLLSGYGVNMKRNALLDFRSHLALHTPSLTGNDALVVHTGILRLNADSREKDEWLIDATFAGFFRMQELTFPYPSSLELQREKQPANVAIQVVARSSSRTVALEGERVDMKLRTIWEPSPPLAQHVIAAAVTGSLKSAFSAQIAARSSRVLVISSSQFLTNPFAFSGNGPDTEGQVRHGEGEASGGDPVLQALANLYAKSYLTNTIVAVKSILDWMTMDAELLDTCAKSLCDTATVR